MPEHSKVFELHKRPTLEQPKMSFAYWYLADALNFEYFHQLCNPDDTSLDYFTANIYVDPEVFQENIMKLSGKIP